MNNIEELIELIIALGGSASVESIIKEYCIKHHMIMQNSYKQTVLATLKGSNNRVLFNDEIGEWYIPKTLQPNKNGKKISSRYEINWNDDTQGILDSMKMIIEDIFEGSDYSVEINPTENEKNLNIYYNRHIAGNDDRVSGIYLKKRTKTTDMLLTPFLVSVLSNKMQMPEIDKKYYPKWCRFLKVEWETVIEMMNNLL